MVERVIALAESLYPVTDGEQVLLAQLCAAACERLNSRLRMGVSPEDCADAYVTAAVWLALDGMQGCGSAGGVKRFSAGDFAVEREETGAGFADRAWALMAPYIRDEGFVFRGVPG